MTMQASPQTPMSGDGPVFTVAVDVDARGMNCPLPILKAKKALAGMQSGELVRVLATDTHAARDFQAFAEQTGNALVAQHEQDGVIITILRRR